MSNCKRSYKNYSKYTFEDFLKDDFFVSSIKNPSSETSDFWKNYLEESENGKIFEAAKDFIETINEFHQSLSSPEIEEMRRNIYKNRSRRKPTRRLLYLSITAVAAIAALFLISRLIIVDSKSVDIKEKTDIMTFAHIYKPEIKSQDIKLIFSDEQAVFLDKDESVITYDTTGIVVDKQAIAKDEFSGFNQLIVPLGKRGILNLSDGTKIWVNSDTRLIYPVLFDDKVREVFVDGEIYIEVVSDANRPFIVKTKDIDVEVLGTKFNVTAYDSDDEKKIVLVSGSVQINSKIEENTTRLTPDQMYISGKGKSYIEKVDTRKHIAWIDGVYYCEDESLDRIFQRLSRYYGVEIVSDKQIGQVLFSGKLDLKDNLTSVLDNISFTLPFSYVEENGIFIISGMN